MASKYSISVPDDGLPKTEVGPWAEDKYRIVALYDELFSTGMRKKWETRVYIDLYAGRVMRMSEARIGL